MPKKKEDQQAGTITVGTAAKLIKVSEVRVRQLVDMGYINRVERGRYNLVNVVHGYIDFRNDDERRASKVAATSRMQDAKTAKIEMELAEKRRDLIHIDEHYGVLDLILAKVRDELLGFAARVTRDVEQRRKIDLEAHDTLNRLSKALNDAGEAIERGDKTLDDLRGEHSA